MTRCIGYSGSSPPLPRGSATGVKYGCVVSSTLVTPTAKSAPPGTRKRRYEASTGRQSRPRSPIHLPTRRRPPGRILPTRDQQVGSHHRPLDPQITNWHISKVTNGPTEALNNLIKRIKRAAFGFRNFANYRIRADPPLRRETQLGPIGHRHSPLKSYEPLNADTR